MKTVPKQVIVFIIIHIKYFHSKMMNFGKNHFSVIPRYMWHSHRRRKSGRRIQL